MRMITTSQTTRGERSIPDSGGSRRRIGARIGSVTWKARRDTGLVGYGLNHENTIRIRTTMRKACSTRTRRPAIADNRSAPPAVVRPPPHKWGGARPEEDLAQSKHGAAGDDGSLEVSAHTHRKDRERPARPLFGLTAQISQALDGRRPVAASRPHRHQAAPGAEVRHRTHQPQATGRSDS